MKHLINNYYLKTNKSNYILHIKNKVKHTNYYYGTLTAFIKGFKEKYILDNIVNMEYDMLISKLEYINKFIEGR